MNSDVLKITNFLEKNNIEYTVKTFFPDPDKMIEFALSEKNKVILPCAEEKYILTTFSNTNTADETIKHLEMLYSLK